jgi:hypothetical protein
VPLTLVLLGAAAFPAAAPARAARLNVSLSARQLIEWRQDLTIHACGGGIFRTLGDGESLLTLHTRAAVPVTARLVRAGGREIALEFPGGTPELPVQGTLTRSGADSAVVIHPGTPGACPPPEPIPPDCGAKPLPADARITVGTDYWPDNRVKHRFDRIALAGPLSRDWLTGPGYRHCSAMGRDDVLAGPASGTRALVAKLPVARVFGKRRRFTVRATRTETVDHMAGTHSPGNTGTRPVVTTTDWRLTFTRRKAHR